MKGTIRKSIALKTLQEISRAPGGGVDLLTATTRAVGDLVPLDGGAFMPMTADGDVTGFFADEVFDETVARVYFERYYDSPREDLLAPSCRGLILGGASHQASRDNQHDWRSTDFYQEVFRPVQADHYVRLFLRKGTRPLGILLLARTGTAKDFSPRELDLLLELRDTLESIADTALRPLSGVDTTKDEEGTWVVRADGEVLMSSARAERLAQMAFGAQAFIPGQGGDFTVWLRRVFLDLAGAARDGRRGLVELSSVYGHFQMEAVELEQRRGGDRCFAVRLSRHVPVKSRLFHSPAFRALPLREKQTVLALVDGVSTNAMAESLGVARSTALTWIRSLYGRFGVAQRGELVATLVEDARLASMHRPPRRG